MQVQSVYASWLLACSLCLVFKFNFLAETQVMLGNATAVLRQHWFFDIGLARLDLKKDHVELHLPKNSKDSAPPVCQLKLHSAYASLYTLVGISLENRGPVSHGVTVL